MKLEFVGRMERVKEESEICDNQSTPCENSDLLHVVKVEPEVLEALDPNDLLHGVKHEPEALEPVNAKGLIHIVKVDPEELDDLDHKGLSSFLPVSQTRGKRKQDKEQVDKANKRRRLYQPHWEETYLWLEHDEKKDLMFCKWCRKYPTLARWGHKGSSKLFVDGCRNYRIESIKHHEKSHHHRECKHEWDYEQRTPQVSTPTEVMDGPVLRTFTNMSDSQTTIYQRLFRTAYFLAKNARPFSDMESLCELQRQKGFDLGDNYQHHKGCKEFVMAISKWLQDTLSDELSDVQFVSVLADGCTDAGVQMQESIFLRYVVDGSPVTRFINLVVLKHCHARGVFSAITSALLNVGVTWESLVNARQSGPSLVSANFDGSIAMQGLKSMVLEKAPEAVPIQCVSHKVELSVLDAIERLTPIQDFEYTLKGIFAFYQNSPKKRRELSDIAIMLYRDLAHFSAIKQVRWLASNTRAVVAVYKNLNVVVQHLEEVASGKGDDAAHVNDCLMRISTQSFLQTLHIMLDFLPILKELSESFQREDLLVLDVAHLIDYCVMRLMELKYEPGKFMKLFTKNLDASAGLFTLDGPADTNAISLRIPYSPVEWQSDSLFNKVVDCTIEYLNGRFGNFKEKPLISFRALDIRRYNLDCAELAQYGREDIDDILAHFSSNFVEVEKAAIRSQFIQLKLYWKGMHSAPRMEVYKELLQQKTMRFQAIAKLVDLMLTVSGSTAQCEKAFSHHNVIKSNMRAHLNQDTLQALMRIKLEGPILANFNPDPMIDVWLTSGKGTRHTGGHKAPTKQARHLSTPNLMTKIWSKLWWWKSDNLMQVIGAP
uniref:TTF-type domain-containing protein n=1 Tax=Eptatretus burgeri TaxID=7764 RepID=A0A8C4NB63_EPTBU